MKLLFKSVLYWREYGILNYFKVKNDFESIEFEPMTPGKPQTRHFNIANCQFSEAIFKVSRVWLEVGIDIIYEYFQCMKSIGLLYLAEKGYWYSKF